MDKTFTTFETFDSNSLGDKAAGPESNPARPRVMVLFHTDLSRIGAVTAPSVFETPGQWVVFGRKGPDFVAPHRMGGRPKPLGDPYISREQVRIRWVEARGRFEVQPTGSKRAVSLVVPREHGEPELKTLTEPVTLPPGSVLSISRRALLLLDVAPWHSSGTDRLGLIGESAPIWALRKDIGAVSRFDKPALVLGPTGAGKELVARAIHDAGPRRDKAFVPVNCAALPEHLVESLLFGYKKGAFTGASGDSKGMFRAADGGTLFLDEFCELPLGLQAKMLRVLQDGCITPVGDTASSVVNVRVVAATNRHPETEVREGRLRQDLFYRVASHVIQVPDLAARRWDVPLLFVHFLESSLREHPELGWLWQGPGAQHTPLPMDFVLAMLRCPWVGNVRELQNVVEQTARLNLDAQSFQSPPLAMATEETPTTFDEDVSTSLAVDEEAVLDAIVLRLSAVYGIAPKTLSKLLDPADLQELAESFDDLDASRDRIADNLFLAFENQGFNQRQLSRHLGMSRTTLIKLMQQFGIPRPSDLDAEKIEAALSTSGGDLEAAARALRVSKLGLRRRVAKVGLESLIK